VKAQIATPAVVEPPKIEQAQNTPPQIPMTQLPPQIQPQEPRPADTKPKLAFEPPPAAPKAPVGGTKIPVPGNTVQEAVRELSHTGSSGVSGSESMDLGTGAGLNLPPSAARPRMDYELKSDPQGVDFRPYILRVLAAVRRNWFAVYPESAKLGTRGQVKLDFAIAKDGKVTKVVYSWQSGSKALDLAAVAAISASNPLPALPDEFHGDRIVLSFTFSYNMGR
jgi:TonB family protein